MDDAQVGAQVASRPTHPWVTAGQGKIRFGVAQLITSIDWPAYLRVVEEAEALGVDSYYVYDHPTFGFDAWTTLSAVAAVTRRMRLGTLTTCIYYRNPALFARMAADVDRISQGRLMLGLGIGDDTHELAQLGITAPPVPGRQQALEEVIQIVEGLWSQPTFTFEGAHFRVAGASAAPGPMQQPRVPLLIAGGGERVTLRQVARYADASNFAASALAGGAFTLEDVRRKYAVLRRECEAVGRPYDSVLRTYLDLPVILGETREAIDAKVATMPPPLYALFQTSLLAATPDEAIAHYRGLVDAGVQYFMATLWGHDSETLHLLAERVMPAVNGVTAGTTVAASVASATAPAELTAPGAPPELSTPIAVDLSQQTPIPSAPAAETPAQPAPAKRRRWPFGR